MELLCVNTTHTCPGPPPLTPPCRQGGLPDHIVTVLSDLLPDHLPKERVKNFFAELLGKQQKREEEKSFSSDSKLSHLWVLKYCANALLLTST